jgi:hypothetical protein
LKSLNLPLSIVVTKKPTSIMDELLPLKRIKREEASTLLNFFFCVTDAPEK